MKVTGIIAEYNPFHDGHAYQLKFAKSFSDAVIVVMSGSFVQRGDAAIFDKWSRTRKALQYGADLVLELPVVFSVNTAERFAFGGVSILDKLSIVDYLLFGSESGNIDELKNAAFLLENEPVSVSKKLKEFLEQGENFPSARQKAFSELIPSHLLSSPNNILGLEYIRQLYRKNSKILPITQKRKGPDYHSEVLFSEFSSATALRKAILEDGFVYEQFSNCTVHKTERLFNSIIYNIRKNGKNAFSGIRDISEGLENRIISATNNANSIDDLVFKVSTKRYTSTRIRRILISSLLGLDMVLSKKEPDYIRVLGATKKGFLLLKEIKSKSNFKIITKAANFKEDNPLFSKDVLSTDIYDLTSDFPIGFGQDFTNSPIIMGGKK